MNDLLLELDQKLACALGLEWSYGTTKHRTGDDWADWEWVGPQGALKNGMKLDRWTESDALCFQLMCDHGAWPFESQLEGIVASSYGYDNKQFEGLEDYPDKITCVRVAIIKAVISKLTNRKLP